MGEDDSTDPQSFYSNNVHLWSTSLNVIDRVYDVLKRGLSSDEWKRANRFIFEQDRRNFIVARGILRDILSQYLHCQPADVLFHYETNGKPGLSLTEASIRLEFNLSHSSGFLVMAITSGKRVGVDVELIRPLPDLNLIASHSFSEYEQNMLSSLTEEEKQLGFFRCWTRKEAYLKARGSGLSIPLDSFDMSLSADNPIGMLSNRLDPDEVSRWSFYTFVPFQGFIGALAIEGQAVAPCFRQWKAAND